LIWRWLRQAGLDFQQGLQGAMEGALGGVGAALKVIGHVVAEAAEAALQPLGGDERIDQGARFGSGGLEAVVIFDDEKFESRGVFAGDDLGLCVDAGFQGIEADCGLALSGGWTSGFLRVEAVGLDLF